MLFRAAKPVLHAVYRQTRGMTLGTRTLVLKDERGEVLLVRHGYAPGWLLPGGGVERGETLVEAAMREVREEAGIVAEEDAAPPWRVPQRRAVPRRPRGLLRAAPLPRGPLHARTPKSPRRGSFPSRPFPRARRPGTRRRIAEVLDGRPPARDLVKPFT